MLMGKYQSVEDKVKRVKRSRHKAAWVGLLVICGIATGIVIVGISYIIMEMNGQAAEPVDDTGADQNDPLLGVGQEQSWIPPDILDQTNNLALVTYDGSLQKRKTVYSTAAVYVLPPSMTPTPPAVTASSEASTTVDPSSTAAMTGNMYCPDPQRPKVLTLCNWVHTPVPGMIDADQVPGTIGAAASSGGGHSATNPFVTVRLTLLGLWAHVRRSVAGAVPSYVTTIRHRSATDLETLHLCAATTGDLWEKSRKLQESLDDVLKLVQMQQGLLNSQEGLIESQRLNLEEMARLLVFVHNQTATTRDTSAGATEWEKPRHQKVM
ncbi:hypothetical protein PG994_001620 [Apiospora phragmitis]|uniref:Uncharacterized protein n=1 Tax=Apiospora phragmitis TaxID=2905665 RepID=A0ABR1WTY7_9PEZI